jgi:putative glutathione S-transferase
MGISNYASKDGEYRRKDSAFRNHIAPGTKYSPEKDRYHLYVSWACPWGTPFIIYVNIAHRTLIVRELKGLQDIITKTVVHYHMGELGWKFVESEGELEGSDPDVLYHAKHLRDIYFRAQLDYEGRFTVPVLWDKKTESIVNNESRFVGVGVMS